MNEPRTGPTAERTLRAGQILALLSLPAAALAVYGMLFHMSYSFETQGVTVRPDGSLVPFSESGRTSMWEYATGDDGDPVVFVWSALVLLAAVLAAAAAWKRRSGPVWFSAVALTALSILGLLSIGVYVAAPAFLLLASAVLLSAAARAVRATP